MNKKDRLSIHIDNGQTDVFEAVTVLRNGGTVSQSGLVGITNIQSQPNSDVMPSAIVPETILNIQASGDGVFRISSKHQSTGKAAIQLLHGGNQPYSGGIIRSQANGLSLAGLGTRTSPEEIDGEPNRSAAITLNREITFLKGGGGHAANDFVSLGHVSSRGAGLINEDGQNEVDLVSHDSNSAVSIALSGYPQRSGTLALREQSKQPTTTANFGKIYVKPFDSTTQTQSLYFSDDAGNEYNLTESADGSEQGLLYNNEHGNTYGGWYTPRIREVDADVTQNTLIGFGIDVVGDFSNNTVLGFNSYSGVQNGSQNTVLGSHSLTQSSNPQNNIILGYNNITFSDGTLTDTENVNNLIIIGNDLFVDNYPEDNTLAIGQDGVPVITGLLRGTSRKIAIISSDSEDTRFTVEKASIDYNLGHKFENSRHKVTFGSQDFASPEQARTMMSMRFSNSLGHEQILMDYDPSGLIPVTPTFNTPTFKRPTVSVSGDLRVLGDIRFSDGTSINGVEDTKKYYGLDSSGVKRLLIGSSYFFGLDFDTVPLASDLVDPVLPGSTYVATDAAGGLGKMSLTSLAAYVTSGSAVFSENCNAVFSNPENIIQTSKNSHSVFIGCDVATNATGWKHGVFIGTNAGLDSTTSNAGLSTDTSCTYIGYKAGESATNTDNAIFIGPAAGKNADSSTKSIFIGPNAGENSTNPNSIGIGPHALGGELSDSEGGSRNIEIVAGLDDNQRLLYTSGELSDTINIQNAIAGNTKTPSISIGKATLTPEAVLEVVRDTTDSNYSLGHVNTDIQRWVNNSSGVASVNESGSFIRTEGCDAWFGNHEGFMVDYIYAPSSFSAPTSGYMRVRSYENGFGTDKLLLVTNRDTRMDIHGDGATGGAAYVVTMMVNGENRPVYVSCSGS